MEKIKPTNKQNNQVEAKKITPQNQSIKSEIKNKEELVKNNNQQKNNTNANNKKDNAILQKEKKRSGSQQTKKNASNEKKEIKTNITKQKLENEKFKKYEATKDNNKIKENLKNKKKKTKIFVISLIATVIALFISVGSNIALGIELNRANILDKITFTKNVEIELITGNSGVGSVTLPNNILPGAGYNQSINFTTKTLNHSLVMRAKAVFTDVMGIIKDASITTTPNWQLGNGGYYYFNGVVNSNNSYLFSKEVILPKEITQSNNNKNNHVLSFICETTKYDNASASVVWENAPTEWLLTYGSGLIS